MKAPNEEATSSQAARARGETATELAATETPDACDVGLRKDDIDARISLAVAEERRACAAAVRHASASYSPKASQRVVCMRAIDAIEGRGDPEQLRLLDERPDDGNSFAREEVSSIYVGRNNRYIVSLIVGYDDQASVETPLAAAAGALGMVHDGFADSWCVFDRERGTTQRYSHVEVVVALFARRSSRPS